MSLAHNARKLTTQLKKKKSTRAVDTAAAAGDEDGEKAKLKKFDKYIVVNARSSDVRRAASLRAGAQYAICPS